MHQRNYSLYDLFHYRYMIYLYTHYFLYFATTNTTHRHKQYKGTILFYKRYFRVMHYYKFWGTFVCLNS